MPRDIRSFFLPKSSAENSPNVPVKKGSKRKIVSSDEEDDKPMPRNIHKRHRIIFLPDSDSNDHAMSESDEETKNKKAKEKKKKNNLAEAKPKKVVSLMEAFGNEPVKREDAKKILKSPKTDKDVDLKNEFDNSIDWVETLENDPNLMAMTSSSNIENKKKTSGSIDLSPPKKGTKDENKDKHKESESFSLKRSPKKTSSTSSCDDEPKKKSSKLKSNSKLEIEFTKPKSKTLKKSEQVDSLEEHVEKKKQARAAYQQYLQRGGAKNPGSKIIPEGAGLCLAGLNFVITGVLDSLERDEAEELIKKYGGKVAQQISKKTNYVIIGDQPGQSKLNKAEQLNTPKITEDDLLEMIKTRPSQSESSTKSDTKPKSKKSSPKGSDSSFDKEEMKKESPKVIKKFFEDDKTPQKEKKEKESPKITKKLLEDSVKSPKKNDDNVKKEIENEKKNLSETKSQNNFKAENLVNTNQINGATIPTMCESEALVEKYRPSSIRQIIGQQGDKSCAKKLYMWLQNWHKVHKKGKTTKIAKPSPWAKNDDGSYFKAALLSGPPGIGKTTTVQVVCKELGFDLVEFNASDTRSKKLLQEECSPLLGNSSMKSYCSDNKVPPSNRVLLMDEVDGMAGNEDRGGLQELISLIKSSSSPIVCICNDRSNPKMRTLADYTFDLKFQKPRLEQIRGAMKSICFKEKINISTEDLDRLIEATNYDLRQVINHLSIFTSHISGQEQSAKKHINKDIKLGPWDIIRMVFSSSEHKTMTLHDKSDLFFHDYNIAPLFVQENYLGVSPNASKSELLKRIAESADSIALGAIAENKIRSNNAWSLLPVQAMLSSVIPGSKMSGHITSQINFPSWLGRNSRSNKFNRLRQEITVHARLTTGASKEAVNLDYMNYIRDAVIKPLSVEGAEGVEMAVSVMRNYHLLREDLNSLIEISLWPGQQDPFQPIDKQIKSAFTRAYTKNCGALPYAVGGTSKKSKIPTSTENFIDDEEEVVGDSSDSDNEPFNKMVKSNKKTVAAKDSKNGGTETKKPTRGRGRGRGKAK